LPIGIAVYLLAPFAMPFWLSRLPSTTIAVIVAFTIAGLPYSVLPSFIELVRVAVEASSFLITLFVVELAFELQDLVSLLRAWPTLP
jgi:hypothetical protein